MKYHELIQNIGDCMLGFSSVPHTIYCCVNAQSYYYHFKDLIQSYPMSEEEETTFEYISGLDNLISGNTTLMKLGLAIHYSSDSDSLFDEMHIEFENFSPSFIQYLPQEKDRQKAMEYCQQLKLSDNIVDAIRNLRFVLYYESSGLALRMIQEGELIVEEPCELIRQLGNLPSIVDMYLLECYKYLGSINGSEAQSLITQQDELVLGCVIENLLVHTSFIDL
ncbi:hypothetical protein JXB41_07565 [Candidatus Woesearchaeota archaeon]|nr:hypothetical protein [Candidatus Woesearchaeota archaeon]